MMRKIIDFARKPQYGPAAVGFIKKGTLNLFCKHLVFSVFLAITLPAVCLSYEVRDHYFWSNEIELQNKTPWQAHYKAILPKGYDPKKLYPVVIFLHGNGGNGNFFIELEGGKVLDKVTKETGVPFIVISPDGGTPDDVDGYWMNAAKERDHKMGWADFIIQELIPHYESIYPVIKSPKARLIAGISMGGHGAFQLSLNYPEFFGATAGHSAIFRGPEEAARDFFYQFGEAGKGTEYEMRDPISLIYSGKRFPGPVWLDMGAQDWGIERARECAHALSAIKSENPKFDLTLKVGDDPIGGHQNEYWEYHMESYLKWYSGLFSRF